MKNRLAIIFVALLALLYCTSCQDHKTFRIGVSQCSQDDWREKMNDEIYREVMFNPGVSVEIRSADNDNDRQIADIRYFLDNDFDIIIAAPNEADAITPVIREVYEAGKPVIVFDRKINGDTYTAFQGTDNFAIGKAAARYAAQITQPGAKVLEIYGLTGSSPAIERHEGFATEAEAAGIEVVATAVGNWTYEEAYRVTDSLLTLHTDIDLIFAHNDRMAIAASDVARRHGVKAKVIGIDAAPDIGVKAVADSVIDATFLYPTEGYRLIRTALSILNGEPFDTLTRLPIELPVDRANVAIALAQNEELKEEINKIQQLKTQMDSYWSEHYAQTTLFYAAIVILLLLVGVLFLLLRSFWQHKRHQNQLMKQNQLLEEQRDAQKELNRQLNVATQSKLMFFTNVSHDLRTPLTLISEPVEQLVDADNLTPQQHALMSIARKNVRILHRLINQILDFRKYENDKLSVNLTEASFATLVADWADAFRAVARKRDIKFAVNVDVDERFSLAIDVEKIERVFFNLMSNAFKYTPDNGHIKFLARVDGDNLIFSVEDTGKGIAAEDIDNIFDRFYQVDKVHPNGSGIGLSLVKAFVELHKGTITVSSQPGVGSVFTVTIPITHIDGPASAPERTITAEDVATELGEVELPQADHEPNSDKPLMLVIDDNEDIRKLLAQLLNDEYSLIFAPNGREGVRLASKFVPDLIICDVMMPGMDGLECCRLIKNEVSTSHIPILMLTACSMDEQRAQGYESGADGYVAKPFNINVLKSRCRNLIENRRRIRDLWSPTTPAHQQQTDTIVRSDAENEFYDRFVAIVNNEMGNCDLNIDSIAARMGLGRSQFYRKIKALTNYSPVELLRNLRLKHSRELLTKTNRSISEIAYECGFSTPAYFTRCYREAFGETPTELRERLCAK